MNFFSEKYQNAKKMESGPFGISQLPVCRKTRKRKGGPFGEKVFEKSLTMSKTTERGALWSRPVLYVTRKKGKPLWFSSLSQ